MYILRGMNEQTKEMVRGWLATHNGDVESLARWMRSSLHLKGGIKACRELIREAVAG